MKLIITEHAVDTIEVKIMKLCWKHWLKSTL